MHMSCTLILGTGGTIAGTSSDGAPAWAYRAAQLDVGQLVAAVPDLHGLPLRWEQVAQVDSKDMGWPVWQALGQALGLALADPLVDSVVITHGTDTLEETAWLLHALLEACKPVVLTAAMRPSTAVDADGPRNLRDAVKVARWAASRGQSGVVAVMQGRVWSAAHVRKAHSHGIDAFDGGGAEPLACLDEAGQPMDASLRPWPAPLARGLAWLEVPRPPRVELVFSHADADGWLVDAALRRPGLSGLVVAATGHGTLHAGLEQALRQAQAAGVAVRISSRVARGGVLPREGDVWPVAGALTPAQARVALLLDLLAQRPPVTSSTAPAV